MTFSRRVAPAVLAVGLGSALLLAGCGSSSAASATSSSTATSSVANSASDSGPSATSGPVAPTAGGPWLLDPTGAQNRIKTAGLSVLTAEGTEDHYHAHLDVFQDGTAVSVPAGIGFTVDSSGQATGISALHTHDTSGVLHVEAPVKGDTFTLGQALTEWGVTDGPTSNTIAGQTGWHVAVDGKDAGTNPAAVVLAAHQEIALYHGTAPANLPTTFSFPAGE